MRYICALTIAGSDCSGGAGIQADVKVMSALGVYAATAITAVTVQNTKGVKYVQAIDSSLVSGQIKAVMEDVNPVVLKIGMVNDSETIQAIADVLKTYPKREIIIDPIMFSTSGVRLMQEEAFETFCSLLLPMATLLTPNLPEAEWLSKMKIANVKDVEVAAQKVLNMGCNAVLIKGGHLSGSIKTDRLYMANGRTHTYEHPTIDTRNTHGTGCTLSSAIASYIARGLDIPNAIAFANNYLYKAMLAGKDIYVGKGKGPVNHFFNPEKLIIL
ncbi:bifunctional hydroxymethylpyrimidine kinase/phosphomethylpyrimidine kinase [Prevotella sp.]